MNLKYPIFETLSCVKFACRHEVTFQQIIDMILDTEVDVTITLSALTSNSWGNIVSSRMGSPLNLSHFKIQFYVWNIFQRSQLTNKIL